MQMKYALAQSCQQVVFITKPATELQLRVPFRCIRLDDAVSWVSDSSQLAAARPASGYRCCGADCYVRQGSSCHSTAKTCGQLLRSLGGASPESNHHTHPNNRGIDSSSPTILAAGPSRERPIQASKFDLDLTLLFSHSQNSRRHVY